MFPIKLTEYLYINPDALLLVELAPKTEANDAFLTVIFENPELSHLYLRGPKALEAFVNWQAAHEGQRQTKQHGDGIE
jgi:hypothetical protein